MKTPEKMNFNFGPLAFTVNNYKGLFFMSDTLKARIAEMPLEGAKAANRAAWKMKRDTGKLMNRYANATLYPGMYDGPSGMYRIADVVAKETYKRMLRG